MLKNKENLLIFGISFLVAFAIFLASGIFIRFQVTLNDFWGVLYYGKHLTLADPASLYNGFFPIGYASLLRFVPYGYVLYFAFVLNIIIMGLFAGWLSTFFYAIKKSKWSLIPVFLATVFYPLTFRYGNTIGPDIGTAVFAFGGIYFLWKAEFSEGQNIHQIRDDILAGLFFGFSALFRSHGIIIAGSALLAYLFVKGIRRMWGRKIVAITLALVFLIQVSVNLISGHGPLETSQNFTAYITFTGGMMDWWHIPQEAYTFSFFDEVIHDPLAFISLWIPLFLKLVVYGIPSLLCVFFLREPREKKFAWFTLIATVIYSAIIAIGTSATDRGPLPLVGPAILCLGLLCMERWSRGQKIIGSSKPFLGITLAVLAIPVIWIGYSWYGDNSDFLALFREQNTMFSQVEDRLVALGIKSPTEAFTNKFVLYFPNMPPYRPYSNGDWENLSWGYREEYPEIPTDSWDKFIAECSKQKIKFLVLSPGASAASDFLGTLYNFEITPPEVEFVGKIHYTRIFKIKDSVSK